MLRRWTLIATIGQLMIQRYLSHTASSSGPSIKGGGKRKIMGLARSEKNGEVKCCHKRLRRGTTLPILFIVCHTASYREKKFLRESSENPVWTFILPCLFKSMTVAVTTA